ncbi:MAG: hypothetical protein PHQ40_21450, partial [Anaerolineaceae bacterium]|nr:hypothetical protein [Anaerolineaceae bacterium]
VFTRRMKAMHSIVAYPLTPASVLKFQVLCSILLKNGVDDKLRFYFTGGLVGMSGLFMLVLPRAKTAPSE